MPVEDEVIKGLGLRHAGAKSLAETSAPVLDWIAEQNITHPAIHFGLDVLEPEVVLGQATYNSLDYTMTELSGHRLWQAATPRPED